jgi:hypothetical protein
MLKLLLIFIKSINKRKRKLSFVAKLKKIKFKRKLSKVIAIFGEKESIKASRLYRFME